MTVTNQFKDRVQLVTYLVRKFGSDGVPLVKAVKLVALADIYALRYYGTTLSKDVYLAMKNGPVASEIDNIIEQSDKYLGDIEKLKYVQEFLRRDEGDTWSSKVRAVKDADGDYLSEWDTETIDMIYDTFKKCTPAQLIDMTHQYSAWKKHEKQLSESKRKVQIDERDFFENDGELSVSPDAIKLSKEFYGAV